MEWLNLNNPIVLAVGGIVLLVVLYAWNRKNTATQQNRRHRSFRESYHQRKREKEKADLE